MVLINETLGVVIIFLLLGSMTRVQWRAGFNQGGSFAEEFSENKRVEGTVESKLWTMLRT